MYHLIVVTPFADYQRGARITDPEIVAQVLNEHHDYVVKIAPEMKE